jgi:radical SAM protein with 4Fe4S-binding SPASM domain
MEITVEQAMQKAFHAHMNGNLNEAKDLYLKILQLSPNHLDANHNIGVLYSSLNELDQALPFFKIALDESKSSNREQYLFSYIDNLIRADKNQEALKVIADEKIKTNIVTKKINDFESLLNLTNQERNYQRNVLLLRDSLNLDYPAHVHLETFAQCNASCNFCPYPTIERQGVKMSDELIEKIISDLEDIPKTHKFQLSPFKVNEPFLDSRLFDLLAKFRDRLPNASVTLTTNATPITESTLTRLSEFKDIGYLWISFNDHREAEYENTMGLPYYRTIDRLNMIHQKKKDGAFDTRVVLSRVGDGTGFDIEFQQWVKDRYPLFDVSIFQRGQWLGQVDSISSVKPPNIGCVRWFDVSITAEGIVAHCCMDGKAEFPIGDVRKSHILEIYNHPEYKKLRQSTMSRLEVEPCRGCSFL